MGIVTMGPALDLTLALRDVFHLGIFVETGTYQGHTTRWAAKEFEEVYTIEAQKEIWENVQPTFEKHKNIKSILGNSGPELQKLVPSLPPSMFFLDAHWSGGQTAGANSECPLLSELAVIMPWFQKHVILIDDARLFLRPPRPPHITTEWPSLDDIFRVIQNASYTTVYKDMIVMIPVSYRSRAASIIQDLDERN